MTDQHAKIMTGIIANYNELTAPSLKLMLDNAVVREISREEYVIRENKPNDHEYFLLEGIMRSTLLNDQHESITTGFYAEGTVLTPHFARTIKGRSIFNLEALTDVILAEMPVTVLDSLRYSFPDIKQFGLKVVEQELLKTIQHDTSFRAMSAKQRLVSFRNNYPSLENIIPHTIIASYLGVTPVSLSRLRNELARQ